MGLYTFLSSINFIDD